MLGTFNNWNIVNFSNKNTSSEDFEGVHKAVPDVISYNMDFLVQPDKHGDMNTTVS